MRLPIVILTAVCGLALSLAAPSAYGADAPAKPAPFLVPSKPGSPAPAYSDAPGDAAHFAVVKSDNVKWMVDNDGDTTAQYAGCMAASSAVLLPIMKNEEVKNLSESLAMRLAFKRQKAAGSQETTDLSLILQSTLPSSARDDLFRIDGKPFIADPVRDRVIQNLPVDDLKKRLGLSKSVSFAFGGGSVKFDAAVLSQVIDKLEACATLKK